METAGDAAGPNSPNGTSGQKRTRAYGEELKGLTPDRESDAGESPSAKRRRRSSSQPEPEIPHADDLDDGEIVELSVAGQAAPHPETAAIPEAEVPQHDSNGQPETGSHNEPTPGASSAEQQSADSHPAVAQTTPDASGAEPSKSKQDKDKSHPSSGGGNQGVGLSLRTSFAKAPPKANLSKSEANSPAIVSFPMMNKDWKINAARFEQLACDNELNHGERFRPHFWRNWMRDNLERIILAFQEENEFSLTSVSSSAKRVKLIRNALNALVGPSGGILIGTKKDKASARSAAKPVFDELTPKMIKLVNDSSKQHEVVSGESTELVESSSKQQYTVPEDSTTPSEHQVTSPDDGEDEKSVHVDVSATEIPALTADELEHRKLYFPGSENNPLFCTHCVSTKHASDSCPQLLCQFCGSAEHTRYGCPTKQRCTKCHQIGHANTTCHEKIALAREEREPCAICGSPHTEDQCVEIWKSFNHTEVEIKKVKTIPCFCYTCGNEGHYGPECGLATKGSDLAIDLRIWSSAIRDLYVDPASPNSAIAWIGSDPSQIKPGQNFNIRGQATKKTHIYYVSSDDSDDGFIHEPVQKSGSRGNIQINTNLSRPGPPKRGGFSSLRRQDSQRRQGQREFSPPPPPPPAYYQANGSWNPPLPSGPPPPMPEAYTFQGNTASLPHPPPGTLPPRPSNQGSRNASSGRGHRPRRGRGRGNR
ncbi:hypothetical protein PFICI_06849 [Pestalotiopsis fici W106-1]|uniref:CCHC-type domain-containing protein n=1 Tax=Pestalotiopsis fici (strain W106-1 / CGMCC3.15140) TaxID=1229662 RepID=W3X8X9_PESFW|nr:uncharacterized protein PFICI_06849 [Pestalotiopsis fici W106-1]ETS81847.1 hypothetical protein PFICI_06849 [Pestalotiopsis fici W106-1]